MNTLEERYKPYLDGLKRRQHFNRQKTCKYLPTCLLCRVLLSKVLNELNQVLNQLNQVLNELKS